PGQWVCDRYEYHFARLRYAHKRAVADAAPTSGCSGQPEGGQAKGAEGDDGESQTQVMPLYALGVLVLVLVGFALLFKRTRKRAIGPAAVGMFYDMMTQDRRNAVEMVVEDK